LAKRRDFVAPWFSLAVASRLIDTAMELIDMRIANFRQAYTTPGKPGIKRDSMPGLGSQTDNRVLLVDQ
jgi:hypothetical protein